MTLQEIAEILDLMVLTALSGKDESHTWPVFYLGHPCELVAGLYGFAASPYFETIGELEAWTQEHYSELYKEYVAPYLEEVKP